MVKSFIAPKHLGDMAAITLKPNPHIATNLKKETGFRIILSGIAYNMFGFSRGTYLLPLLILKP